LTPTDSLDTISLAPGKEILSPCDSTTFGVSN
jgi:hypothetical protein